MSGEMGKNNRGYRVLFFVLASIVGLALGYYFWTRGKITTDDAYVEGRIYALTPRVTGYVTEVLVDDNQEVKTGQLLLILDPTEYEVALAEARAAEMEALATLASLELGVPLELTQTAHRVSGAQAQVDSLKKSLEVTQKEEEAAAQEVRRTAAQYDQALLDQKRMRDLGRTRAVAQSAVDEAETRAAMLQAQLGAARAKMESVRKQRASLEASLEGLKANLDLAATGEDLATIKSRQVEAQKARVDLARTRIRQAELNLQYTRIVSPVGGAVTKKRVEPGQMVSRGQPLMAVVPLNPAEMWITANYKETQVTGLRPGQRAVVRLDTYPGLKLNGRVASIMSGTGAAFSLFPPENATGNFVKIVQRVPVRILLDLKDLPPGLILRLGLSAIPTVYLDE
ncbi:MAG: HlyD family secretion protein [Thermodesulfobacteriota bacterium]